MLFEEIFWGANFDNIQKKISIYKLLVKIAMMKSIQQLTYVEYQSIIYMQHF